MSNCPTLSLDGRRRRTHSVIAAVVGLACLAVPLLPARAGKELRVSFVNNEARDGGELVLTHPGLSPQYFPQDQTGTARVDVTELKPDLPGVFESTSVSYEIRNGKLTARVSFKRPRQQVVAFTLTLYVPDTKGNENPFVASASINPVRGQESPEQGQADTSTQATTPHTEHPSEPAKPGTVTIDLRGAPAVEVRSLERVNLVLKANHKAPVRILIKESSTGKIKLERTAEVDVAEETIQLDISADPNLVLLVCDEEGKVLYQQRLQFESWRLLHRALAITSVNLGLLLAGLLVLAFLGLRRWLHSGSRWLHGGKRWPPIWRRWFRRGKEQTATKQASTSPVLIQSGPEQVAARPKLAGSAAVSAMQTAGQAQGTAEGPPKGLDEPTVRDLVTALLERRLGSGSALDSLIAAAGSPPETHAAPPGNPEQLLLAAVNYWLTSHSRDRAELVRLSEAIGLGVQLYAHKNLTRLFSDITRFVYEFEPSERDGGWLWVAGSDSEEFLAVPSDAAFFQVGKAPDLLDRLFHGMQRAGDVFQFRRIYRACRLRRSPDGSGYKLAEKGCLQLEGDAAPNLPMPPAYHDLRARGIDRGATPAAGQPLADTLRTAFLQFTERLQRAQAGIDDMRQQLAEAQKQNAAQAGKLSEVEEEMASLRPELDELSTRSGVPLAPSATVDSLAMRALRDQMDARLGAVERNVVDLMMRLDEFIAKPKTERRTGGKRLAEPAEEAVPAGGKPASGATAGSSQVGGGSEGLSVATGSPVLSAESADLLPSMRRTVGLGKFPEAWRDALHAAAGQSGAPSGSELVSKALFLLRLTELAQALSNLPDPTASPVSIAHLRVQGEAFEIHDTDAIPQNLEERMCRRCQVPHCFQLVVCAGASGDGEVGLLYPLGVLVPSNYPAGYTNLVEGCPAIPFLISDIRQPARLARIGKDVRAVYQVLQRLHWNGD